MTEGANQRQSRAGLAQRKASWATYDLGFHITLLWQKGVLHQQTFFKKQISQPVFKYKIK